MGRLDKLKRQAINEANIRVLGEQEEIDPYANKIYDPINDEWVSKEEDTELVGNSDNEEDYDKEEWKNRLHQRLWAAIEDIDDDRETEAAIKLNNEDVIDVLLSIVNSLDDIDDYDDDDIDDDGDGPTTPWEAIKYGLTPKIKINDKKIN